MTTPASCVTKECHHCFNHSQIMCLEYQLKLSYPTNSIVPARLFFLWGVWLEVRVLFTAGKDTCMHYIDTKNYKLCHEHQCIFTKSGSCMTIILAIPLLTKLPQNIIITATAKFAHPKPCRKTIKQRPSYSGIIHVLRCTFTQSDCSLIELLSHCVSNIIMADHGVMM